MFCSTISGFQDTRSLKIEKAPNDPILNLNTHQSKLQYIHLILSPDCRPTCSTISSFQDTRSLKIGNAPNDPKLKLNTNSQKYSTYTKHLPVRPKFWSISL